jgi:imidazolonepropionase-like amidohydrolase
MPHRLGLGAFLVALAVPLATHAAAPTPFAPPATDRVLYRKATLIDGRGGPPRPAMDVLVAGERIVQVLPDAEVDERTLASAKVVDLHGRFLLPGLIDAHVHLATPPNRRQAEAVLRRDLYGGVTAVRDMADDLRSVAELARESLVGEIAAPDIAFAALMAGTRFFTDPRIAQVSAGGESGKVPWAQEVTDGTDLPLAVAWARGTGAMAIKLYADLTGQLAARITAEAHRQHLRVWAHATLYPAKPSEVVAAGVDAISHACLLAREPEQHVPVFGDVPWPPPQLDLVRDGRNPALDALFAEMKRRGTVLDATLWTYAVMTTAPGTTAPLTTGKCDDGVGGAMTGQAARAGVVIAAGTDNVGPWNDAWPDLFHELARLESKAGMSRAAVLQSATLGSARATGWQDTMGSVEAGKLANLVVLAKDPLADLVNLRSVVMTVKRGRVFPRTGFKPLRKGDITDS